MYFTDTNPRIMNIQPIPDSEPRHQAKEDINNCNASHIIYADPTGSSNNSEERKAKEAVNELNQKLCEACRHLEKHGLIYRVSGELRKWWTSHRQVDRKQLKFKEDKSEDGKILKKALLKLSSRELELILKANQ